VRERIRDREIERALEGGAESETQRRSRERPILGGLPVIVTGGVEGRSEADPPVGGTGRRRWARGAILAGPSGDFRRVDSSGTGDTISGDPSPFSGEQRRDSGGEFLVVSE
jgi:hypothetical protein